MKIIKLRTALTPILKEVHPKVYYEKVSSKATFPYIVFNFPNSTDDGSLEQFVLDVDAWDDPEDGDTTILETLISNIDQILNRRTISIGNIRATIYRDNRLVLEDDDPRIRRRKYIYQVRTYEKRGLN